MAFDEIIKQLEKHTKKELLDLIVLMMNKNDNNRQLIYNKFNHKNPKADGLEVSVKPTVPTIAY